MKSKLSKMTQKNKLPIKSPLDANTITTLIVGAFLGYLINLVFTPAIPGYAVAFLIFVTLVTIVLAFVNTSEIQKSLDDNRSQIQKILGGQNEIIAEPSIEGLHSNQYQGFCYEKLIELVENAEKSIFSVVTPLDSTDPSYLDSYRDKEPRIKYLRKIEDKLKKNPNFKYTRIQQFPSDYAGKISNYFGIAASNHIEELLQLRLNNDNIRLQYIKGGEIPGFIILDNSIFVRFILAIDSNGKKVSVGISIQENLTSNTIKEFCERYCTMISDNYHPQKIKEDML